MHLQNGIILLHFNATHGRALKREILVDNVRVIAKERDVRRLRIKEALLILQQRPGINKQFDAFPHVLRLYGLGSACSQMGRGDELGTIGQLVGDDTTGAATMSQFEKGLGADNVCGSNNSEEKHAKWKK